MKKYFHELTDEELQDSVERKATYDEFLHPEWCGYPNALDPLLGCWSLTDPIIRKKICKEFCKECDNANEKVK